MKIFHGIEFTRIEKKIADNAIIYEEPINLLNSISSFYIVKQIFKFIREEIKLEFIINNKKLQNKFHIDINHYKKISGKYIIGERNGYGKEYTLDNKIIFEGKYLNGKRNGYGKEYDYRNRLIFEGEYLNNKKIKGKKYDKKGNLILRIGKNNIGNEYYFNRNLQFIGEYLNGKRWNGIGYDIDGFKQFEIKNGNGFVKEYNYEGNIIYEGQYINGVRNGKGKEYNYKGGIRYIGEYLNGKREGRGKEYYLNGNLENEGEYKNGLRNGKCIEYNLEGKLEFEGEYLNGNRNGKGKEYSDNGELKFEGEYYFGFKWNGKIKQNVIELFSKTIYEGEYLNGQRNGKGKEYDFYNGSLIYEGIYVNGERYYKFIRKLLNEKKIKNKIKKQENKCCIQ